MNVFGVKITFALVAVAVVAYLFGRGFFNRFLPGAE
jgi:hypothetical protein